MELLKQQPYNPITTSISKIVIFGTIFGVVATIALLIMNPSINSSAQMPSCLAMCGVAFLYMVVTSLLLRRNHYPVVAYLLVIFYMLLATGIVWIWGINVPIGLLIFTLVIILAGILLTARCAFRAAVVAGLVLITTQTAINRGWHQADTSWMTNQSYFGNVFAYFTVFIMLALISWLYNREMERSLAHAKQAELALIHQKSILKIRVKERTAELRKLQLEEMQHMYRFAELGHLGVTLLHDLANHLTALTLEIESMQSEQYTQTIGQVRRIIHYLETIVDDTRGRLGGNTQKQTFNIIRKMSEVVTFLQFKATKAGVIIDWEPLGRTWDYTADPDSFSQVIAIIVSNAIDAYAYKPNNKVAVPKPHHVMVAIQSNNTHFIIRVSDWGKGITISERKHLFKPTHSTKKSGLGLGLYIAKQITEMQFSGSINLSRQNDHTEFIITLPRT